MDCQSCGHANRADASFCEACGAQLARACAACGASVRATARFCDSCGQPLADAEPAPPAPRAPEPSLGPRTRLAEGRYELQRFLGEGGRKRVYLAHDNSLGRDVAVALIKTEGLDERGMTRARREAEAMARLGDHPHIVTVYDIGDDEGHLFIVSQYMAGGDLEGLLARFDRHRVPAEQALKIGKQIASALEYAHGHGVVHRDIKPKNIWLTEDGTAKLGDFGLAVALDRSRITLEGMMIGTVAYMAPELGLGRPADARSDLYSFGALLYEMVCGRPPFVGDDAVAIISQHIGTAPIAPSWHNADVPRAVEEMILKLLAKAPEERPQSAATVGEAIETISSGEFVAPPSISYDRANPLDQLTGGVFVGRERETQELRGSLEAVLSGRGRLVMVAGDMGIGKTRIASELATYASLRGAQALWGRCYEGEGAPAYWPWVQVIRSYVHDRDPDTISSEMGSGAGDIAQVVSEVRERLPGVPTPPALEPEQARFRLFDSIATFLKNAAVASPLVLILDDLHWADRSSLLLLQFLATELQRCRVLIVGAYRDTELGLNHPLSDVLAALRRERVYKRVLLRGLSAEEVRAMLETVAEHELGSHEQLLVTALHHETEGNPFFLEEIVRHLVESGRLHRREGRWVTDALTIEELGIPEGIRETISRRLDRLSKECKELLVIAAVIGREFRTDVLARVAGVSGDDLLEALDQAVAARVIAETPDTFGQYRFSHGLTRETLYDQLTTARRVRLHREIAEAIEEIYAERLEPHIAELAYHFNEAVQAGGAEKAVQYAIRAAERATASLAYEEAVSHYERALHARELAHSTDEGARCELLLAFGGAQWRAGHTAKAKETFREASAIARGHGTAEQLAQAALGYGAGLGWFGFVERADEKLVRLLEEALEALPDADSVLRARVLARLAVELYYTRVSERRASLSLEAVEMAERVGDPKTQLIALYSRQWSVLGPESLDERLSAADEMLRLAGEIGDREMQFRAHHLRFRALLERAEVKAMDAELEHCRQLADELREPFYLWVTRMISAMRAMLDGDFEGAHGLTQEALAAGQRGYAETATVLLGAQTAVDRWLRGGLDEIIDQAKLLVERYPWLPVWRAVAASFLSELGRLDDARADFELLAANGFVAFPRDGNWLLATAVISRACARLGDAERAAVLYDMLLPYADRCVGDSMGDVCLGSVASFLGSLAATLSRWEESEAHFEAAIKANRSLGRCCPMEADTQHEYARMLLARNATGDRARAIEVLSRALDMAEKLGMKPLMERALALRMETQGIAAADVMTSIDVVAQSLELERPDLRPHAAPDGTVTLLFTDIENSSAMTESLGDRQWLEVLREHNRIVRKQLAAHGGYEVKAVGDGFMAAFSSARRAVQCALAVQREFAAYHDDDSGLPLHMRIGLHTGEPIRDEDDFFGKHVILAARIAAEAKGDEILVSSLLKELLESSGEVSFSNERVVELKGLAGSHRVFAVSEREVAEPALA